ncbi:tail protein X [Chromobacterium sp. Beijing]|nr:tail protein X [Chromobacterium sp. Beijing]
MMRTVRAQQHDSVDAIAWRHYGKTAGVVEAILASNPGLADHGPTLPMGLAVQLPELDAADADPVKTLINLWD